MLFPLLVLIVGGQWLHLEPNLGSSFFPCEGEMARRGYVGKKKEWKNVRRTRQ